MAKINGCNEPEQVLQAWKPVDRFKEEKLSKSSDSDSRVNKLESECPLFGIANNVIH